MPLNPEAVIARAFGMDDATWARHANPWSVWTRVPILLLFAPAIWSRVWIGWWALLPVGLLILWTWINPRAFPPPRTLDHWASRAVLGERLWIDRHRTPIPPHHRLAPHILSALSTLGLPFLLYGLCVLHFWSTLLGLALVYFGKLWFLDRMAWLARDMSKK